MKNELAHLDVDRVIPFGELHPDVQQLFKGNGDGRYSLLSGEQGIQMVIDGLNGRNDVAEILPTINFPYRVFETLEIPDIDSPNALVKRYITETTNLSVCGVFISVRGKIYFILTRLIDDLMLSNQHSFDHPPDIRL